VDKVLFVLCICISISLGAQIPSHKVHRSKDMHKGKLIELGPLQVAQVRSDDKDKNTGAYKFAERRDVDLTPFNSGEWHIFEEYHEWTLSIHSKNAASLNLGFSEYRLPANSSLSIISGDGQTLGPFTKADNKDHLQLWTPIIIGDKLSIKLRIPELEIQNLDLRLTAVNHGFRFAETRSASGSCNIDVLCGDEDSFPLIRKYQDQIHSVGVVQVRGSLLCSGFLINNANNDFTPYFITAAHCGIDRISASSCVVYWNFENSFCRPPDSAISGENGDGTLTKFNTGASLVSTAISGDLSILSVDFTLIRLNDPIDPDYSPYFSGWDINPSFSDTTFTVHHPNAEEKRISFDFESPRFAPMLEDSFIVDNQLIEDSIFVRVLDWELGTTEFGSSGAPLFNKEGNAIGFLSGGKASCIDRDEYDDFGWLGLAWENENSPETSLKEWLDPNNTGVKTIGGLSGSFSISADEPFRSLCGIQSDSIDIDIQVDSNFKNNVQLSVSDLPAGISGSFSNSSPAPGENTNLILRNLSSLSSGMYEIKLEGTDGENKNSNKLTLDIISNVPNTLEVEFPKSAEAVNVLAEFNWSGNADLYEIEISKDISFANPIVNDNSINRLSYSTSELPLNSEFFWRVRGMNFCGNSAWSKPELFRTSSLKCEQVDETDLNIEISDSRFDTITSMINITKSELIESVSIPLIEGEHSYSSDLIFNLISPAGTKVNLASSICAGAIAFLDFKIGFNDKGFSRNSIPCPFTDGSTYKPEEPLDIFKGENPQGLWTLEIIDVFEFDAGALQSWSLQICSIQTSSLFSTFPEQTINACGLSSISSSIELSQDFQGAVSISVEPANEDLSLDLSNTTADPGETINFTINNIDVLNDETSSIRFIISDGTQVSESVLVLDFESSFEDIDLFSPLNNTIIRTGDIIDFDWNDVEGITGYTLQLTTDPTFSTVAKTIAVSESNQSIALDFIEQGEASLVYWRIIAEGSVCSKFSEVFSFLADFTDVIVQIENTDLNIYPNPTTDLLFIESIGVVNSVLTTEIFDISGKRLQTIKIASGQVKEVISMVEYAQGVYFVKLTSNMESQITKIVKQ